MRLNDRFHRACVQTLPLRRQEIYEIHFDGQRFVATECVRHDSGANAIMNCAYVSDSHDNAYLATGQENHCQLYQLKTQIVDVSKGNTSSSSDTQTKCAPQKQARQRKNTSSAYGGGDDSTQKAAQPIDDSNDPSTTPSKRIIFAVQPADSVQTDFDAIDPLQRCVRIAPSGKLLATGGADGHIRVWSFPQAQLRHDIAAHAGDADDVDFSPDSRQLVSIGKDRNAVLWSAETGAETGRLQWRPPAGMAYAFKRCRFAVNEGKSSAGRSRLFTISNPVGKVPKAQQRGVLQQWCAERGQVTAAVEATEFLSALAVRDDGRFVAVGTMFTGSVSIYVAFSLQVSVINQTKTTNAFLMWV